MGRQSTGRVTPMLMLSGRRIQMIEIALTNLAEKRSCGVCVVCVVRGRGDSYMRAVIVICIRLCVGIIYREA
jgi:hypothetical protein